MIKAKTQKIDLRPYYTWGLPLLALMGLIALSGIALDVVMHLIK